MNKLIQDNFITNISERRKIIDDFCRKSSQFNVIVKKIEERKITDSKGNWLYDFSTQDYLGFTFEPDQIAASIEATKKFGTVVYWCRIIATVNLFTQAEEEIAKLVGSETSSIFASTTLLNHGVIPALMGEDGGVMFLDKTAHATMYEGCKMARDSGSKLVNFSRNDLESLEILLSEYKDVKKKLILVDGVYSMSGDYANLPELDKLAKKYDALIFCDDAHGFGVVGENPDTDHPYGFKGNGLVKYYGLDYENILYIGCFSKAYGTFGAFLACSQKMKEFILSQATPHDLGGAGPASAMAVLLSGLRMNQKLGDRKRTIMSNLTQKAIFSLRKLGLDVTNHTGFPILYVKIGSNEPMLKISEILYQNHILTTPSPYPMVRRGEEGFRVTITSTNTEEQVSQLIIAFSEVKKYLVTQNYKFKHNNE